MWRLLFSCFVTLFTDSAPLYFAAMTVTTRRGQWSSTEPSWDQLNGWSLFWQKTMEANGMCIISWGDPDPQRCAESAFVCFRPLWLSPRQVMVVPVGPTCEEYAQKVSDPHSCNSESDLLQTEPFKHGQSDNLSYSQMEETKKTKRDAPWRFCAVSALVCLVQVRQQFHVSGFMTDVDVDPGCTLNKKIRNAQLAQYNFILGRWQHLLSLHLSPSHLHLPYYVLIWFSFLLVFLEQWWERRRRQVTPWTCALVITKCTASAAWTSASSVSRSWSHPGFWTLRRTSELLSPLALRPGGW